MDRFSDNVSRLLGVHALPAKEAASMLGMSQSTFTKWATGQRSPSFTTALRIGEFFGVGADRLATADFGSLLEQELASAQRFEEVEAEIRRRRSTLQAVGDRTLFGKPRNVIEMEEAAKAQRLRRRGKTDDEIRAALAEGTAEDDLVSMDTPDDEGSG